MVKRVGSIRKRSREKFTKSHRDKGKISLSKYFQKFEVGETVGLSTEPAVHHGMYHPRFYGKTGIVTAKSGTCYEITIKDINKTKKLMIHPVHLLKRV